MSYLFKEAHRFGVEFSISSRCLLLVSLVFFSVRSYAVSDRMISPYYFGPNAFPVPALLDGSVCGDFSVDVGGDYFWGFEKDKTADIAFGVRFPLFSRRISLHIWGEAYEFYWMTEQRTRTCELDSTLKKGHLGGEIYVSTDFQLIKNRRFLPDLSLRVALKSAAGGGYKQARHYDAPGYWFDLSVGKSLIDTAKQHHWRLRLAGTIGFLCWQTGTGRQNDAYLYGVNLAGGHRFLSLTATWAGYSGWRKNGDKPMICSLRLTSTVKNFEPYLTYLYGIRDFPFHQIRAGIIYKWDIINFFHQRKSQ